MTDRELADAAWAEFAQTTVGWNKVKGYPSAKLAGTHWGKGKAWLDMIGRNVVATPAVPIFPGPPAAADSSVTFTVNPKGVATTVYVDYGADFKTFASTSAGTAIGAGGANVVGSIALAGLAANSVYFYRVRAVNAQGSSVSLTYWFLTAASAGATNRDVGSGKLYATINAALAASVAGDTVTVFAGSYAGFTLTKNVAGIIRILRNGSDVVTINDVQHSGAKNIYWGPGFKFTGATFASASGSHLLDFTNSTYIYLDSITSEWNAGAGATGDCSPFWMAAGLAENIYAMGCVFSGGGVCKSYDGVGVGGGGAGLPANWPGPARFLQCEWKGQAADFFHMDGFTDFVFESCYTHDPNTTAQPAEHHDGIQAVYGDKLIVRRHTFAWAGANNNGNNQGIILGDTSGRVCTNASIENVLVRGFNGCGINTQGAGTVARNITQWNTFGVLGGPVTQQNEDYIIGYPGDSHDLANVVAYRPYDNGGAGASHSGHHNHCRAATIGISGLTNTSFGASNFVSASDTGDFHPTLGGSLDRTGGADANTPLWDIDGRGYGPTMSKGCYAPTDVTTPLVVSAGFTP